MFGYLEHASRVLNWLLIVFVIVAAIIGLLFLTRGTAVRRVRSVGVDGTPVGPNESEFVLTIALLTGTPVLAGNRVEIALNGDETYPRLWADLRAATQSITIQMYYTHPGQVADTLTSILEERARAGVVVLLLYDAFGSRPARAYLKRLRSAGVRAVPFRPFRFDHLWIVQNRSHIRGFIVDGKIAWTGGFGIDDKWLGGGHKTDEWRDTNVRFEGPAVRQLQRRVDVDDSRHRSGAADGKRVLRRPHALKGDRPPDFSAPSAVRAHRRVGRQPDYPAALTSRDSHGAFSLNGKDVSPLSRSSASP
jgi:phosphatidylserine/phosphatidylglycerophosphate/cardiolipin synthase-like enzyme